MLPVRVFDVDRVLELIERERVTMLPGPPTLYHSLLAVRGQRDVSSLRAAVTGSADIPVELIRRIRSELPFQSIITGYGLTEADTVTASRRGDSFENIATTAGRSCDDIEVRIADDGEVLVRGYNVMQGYLGGFNAYPAEIEGFLLEHPAVAQAAVIGVPDERLGEVGKAFVVPKSPVSEEDLIAWSRKRMAGFKVPRSVEFLDTLPLNATAKVMKSQLR